MMKRTTTFLMLMAGATLSVSGVMAEPGKIGGFDIPGKINGTSKKGKKAEESRKLMAQVVVSQSAGSQVTSVNQAMALVQPGGTILVRGGVYNENINVLKPVAIIGTLGDYGREPIIRPSPQSACVTIAPSSPVARVSIEKLIFEFDHRQSSGACINVAGGSVAVRDSAILPIDSDIPIRAAYGTLRPELNQIIARPPLDRSAEPGRYDRLEKYIARHARPVGAAIRGWDYMAAGNSAEKFVHSNAVTGGGILNGPAAGVRVLAGEVSLDNNTIIGTRTAVEFSSQDRALVQGRLDNNVLIGNGVGIAAAGRLADLEITRNTIKFNAGEGVKVDARDAYGDVKILANLITGNGTGVYFSEKVRSAFVNSNLVAQNYGDAMLISSGFFGAVAGNTFADNEGCTVQFFSAQQRELNRSYVKVVAGEDFKPGFTYLENNFSADNAYDEKISKRQLKRLKKAKIDPSTQLPSCASDL